MAEMDLLSIVVQPTWREFLMELVATSQMDPWDLDLVEVADKYIKRVREFQVLDLRVPANVILASALLLRFKADALSFEEPAEEEFFEDRQLISEDIPELVFRTNRPRSRRVTLEELLNAVEQVLKDGGPRRMLSAQPKILSLEVPLEDMSERMRKVYDRALALRDSQGIVLFSSLLHGGECDQAGKPPILSDGGEGNSNHPGCGCVTADSLVGHLLPVLHLVQDRRMLAWQDALFGEIFLRVWTDAEIEELKAQEAAAQAAQAAAQPAVQAVQEAAVTATAKAA